MSWLTKSTPLFYMMKRPFTTGSAEEKFWIHLPFRQARLLYNILHISLPTFY